MTVIINNKFKIASDMLTLKEIDIGGNDNCPEDAVSVESSSNAT